MKATLLQQLICEHNILASVSGAVLNKDLAARNTVPDRYFSEMLRLWCGPRRAKCIIPVRDAAGKDDIISMPLFIQLCHVHGYPVVHTAQTENRLTSARRLMHLKVVPEGPGCTIGCVNYMGCWDCPLHSASISDPPSRLVHSASTRFSSGASQAALRDQPVLLAAGSGTSSLLRWAASTRRRLPGSGMAR
jgi:hypothetical protein